MAGHPGFKAVQAKIAKRTGEGKKAAGAMLAAATRRASKKAKAKNPRLKRVKMPRNKGQKINKNKHGTTVTYGSY